MKKNIVSSVEEISIPLAQDLGLELIDVEYVKEAGELFLRVYLDTDEGITLDECEAFSRKISDILDEKDFIKDNYYLEVSSPGLERPLKKDKDFERYRGHHVFVKLYKAKDGIKQFEGELIGLNDDGQVEVMVDDEKKVLDRKEIAIIRLAIQF